MAGVDVDDIWAEMQKEQGHVGSAKSAVPRKAFDLSALQFTKKKTKKKVGKLDQSLQWMQAWGGSSVKRKDQVGDPQDAVLEEGQPSMTDMELLRMSEPPSTLMDILGDIPMDTPETFLAYLQRDINCLSEESLGVRQQSLVKLEKVLVQQVDNLPVDIIDAVADALLKPLLKRVKDKSEKCRELSVRILRSLVENTSDLASMLPYVFPILVMRLGAEDIEGVAHLPEVMRPAPEQKPTEIARPCEESEEVRLELAHFVSSLLRRCNQAQIYSYVDEATGLIRAGVMDPFHEVKNHSCETMTAFCYNHHEMLLHFAEPMGRSLTSCLTHNHAKLRIAALRALTAVLNCGVWKHNHEVIQMLVAWQDPNQVQIKAFFESVTSVNYMSTLSFDRHPAVRRFWYETLAYWLLRIPDKCDHEPYIFPYLLTGLCDENEEIALECFWLIEKCGELYEQEKEEDLRKTRQYGFDHGWTYEGRAFVPFPLQGVWAGGGKAGQMRGRKSAQGPDMMGEKQRADEFHSKRDADGDDVDYGEEVEVPRRDYAWPLFNDLPVYRNLPRPRLGSRCWVRTNCRRYIKATFNDVVDFRDCTALNAGRLLCMSIAYTEEGVTEWLQPMIAALVKFYSGRAAASGDKGQVMQTYDCVCKLTGGFLDPDSVWLQLKDAFDNDSSLNLDQRVASVHVMGLVLEGTLETLLTVEDQDAVGLGRLARVLPELISTMHASDLLMSPSDSSRKAMWAVLFAFLEPVKRLLTFTQVSQLLYVALALAAKDPDKVSSERAAGPGADSVETPQYEEEEVVDADKLMHALDLLSSCVPVLQETELPALVMSLDDMDDGPSTSSAPAPSSSDPRVVHLELFKRCFPEVLARLDDSFQVFRSVLYLSPLAVLTEPAQAKAVLERLSVFCGITSSPPTRAAGHALGMHLACRLAKVLKDDEGSGQYRQVHEFLVTLFQTMANSHIEAGTEPRNLSHMVMVSSLALMRRFFLGPYAAFARDVVFPASGEQSRTLQWLSALMADQELYKRFHAALELAEIALTGKNKDDFVIKTLRKVRETAEHRANVVRTAAGSTILLVLRTILQDGKGAIPWAVGKQAGSARALFLSTASLFRTAPPTLPPNFIRPITPSMCLYAAEILHLFLNQDPDSIPAPYQLQDDAARAIYDLRCGAPELPISLEPEEREQFVAEFVVTLVDLNLTLPPDPEAKHAPVTLGDNPGEGDIILGYGGAAERSSSSRAPGRSATSSTAAVPSEVSRLLSQGEECLKWNAALALYTLGADISVVCKDGFQRSLEKWKKRKEQAKVLVSVDLLARAVKAVSRPSKGRKQLMD